MAPDEIRLWALDGSGGATPLDTAQQTDSERLLEDTLVNNPDMLMPGLTLVGRQTRTEGGTLDLLGVDDDGRLVVFELKRGTLSREAVAQVINYASFLDAMPDENLASFISEQSVTHGVEKIDDFIEWYDAKYQGQELSALKPVRMVLVGLGVDETTNRMARFLADRGVDVSLLTFLGFRHAGQTLLARQVQVEVEAPAEPEEHTRTHRRLGRRKRRELLDSRIQEHTKQWPEAQELWDAVLEMFLGNFPGATGVAGGGKSKRDSFKRLLRIHVSEVGKAIAAIQLGPDNHHPALVSAIYFPNAVKLCLDEFTLLRQEIPFKTWPPNNPRSQAGAIEIQFQFNSLADWETHKDKLAAVTRSVYEAHYANEDEE